MGVPKDIIYQNLEINRSPEINEENQSREHATVHVGVPVRRILRKVLSRRDKEYSPADLELFSQYIDVRSEVRPRGCDNGEICWVRQGPPACGQDGPKAFCSGCHGSIYYRRSGP